MSLRVRTVSLALMVALVGVRCARPGPPARVEPAAPEGAVTATVAGAACVARVGAPRVEEVAPGIFVALGFDLANVMLIQTPKGNVFVDAAMSRARAAKAKAALLARAPGPTAALIYTHSHVDHVGGAAELVEPGTPIWATVAFVPHLLKQYGLFQPTEGRRGARQFGRHLGDADACSALGLRVNFDGALHPGVRFPTHTFTTSVALDLGRRIELYEAHGETDDHLFVWVPDVKVLLPGDDLYAAFPNVYTIRGTRPRPVAESIDSLDHMRRLAPDVLVPSHTEPVRGAQVVAATLRDYRDALQWVRDSVVRRTNAGEHLDDIVATLRLPPHLAARPGLAKLYGRVNWSARAIYSNELGWFDEDPEDVAPLPARTLAEREVALMGGATAVRRSADEALRAGDAAWALHLLGKLRKTSAAGPELDRAFAAALQARAATEVNTNARGYLLESAWEFTHAPDPLAAAEVDDALLAALPLSIFLGQMATRLRPETALDVEASVTFTFTDTGERYTMTVRRGVAELAVGAPLPGTPPPIASVTTTSSTWKRLALGQLSAASALAGDLVVENKLAFLTFVERFDRPKR